VNKNTVSDTFRFVYKDLLLKRMLNKSSASIFLVGGGRRTGTTLLAAVLSSDKRANPLGQEAQILTRIIEAYRWGRERFEQFGCSFFDDPDMYRTFFQEIVDRFQIEVSERISSGVLVLKNPEFSLVMLDIAELFPYATLLVTVRDPRDQIASELEVSLRRLVDNGQDPRLLNRNIADLAGYYVNYYREILELRARQPGRIHVVRYEDLVLQAAKSLNEIRAITGLKLSFDPKKTWSRVSDQASLHSGPSRSDLYGAPIDARSVGRYKRDLSIDELNVVEEVCSELMDEFDYQRNA